MLLKFFKEFRGLYEPTEAASVDYIYETAEPASAVSIRPRKPYISNNYPDFLGKFEAICETALDPESGPRGIVL
jgi:hypothetical protein